MVKNIGMKHWIDPRINKMTYEFKDLPNEGSSIKQKFDYLAVKLM